jgi:hypothetical protein
MVYHTGTVLHSASTKIKPFVLFLLLIDGSQCRYSPLVIYHCTGHRERTWLRSTLLPADIIHLWERESGLYLYLPLLYISYHSTRQQNTQPLL